MSASIITTADAVVAQLNASSAANAFTPYTFTAVRQYAPILRLEDMDVLHVLVCPRALNNITIEGRGTVRQDEQIDIGVMIRPTALTNAVLDPLMLLVERMADVLRLGTFAGAGVPTTAIDPVFAAEHLRELKQFTSVITMTLRRVR